MTFLVERLADLRQHLEVDYTTARYPHGGEPVRRRLASRLAIIVVVTQ